MTTQRSHGLGARETPEDILLRAWPITAALGPSVTAPVSHHDNRCTVTLNQGSYGACTCFSGVYMQDAQEYTDEGVHLIPDVLDPLHTYAVLKGLPFPFTVAQDKSPGLYAVQVWKYAQSHGWLTKDGSEPRKIANYFTLGKPSGTAAFLAQLQQAILQLGPVQFVSAWPVNWFSTDSTGHMALPNVTDGAHAYECCGWQPCGSCACGFDTLHHQSWGTWGKHPTYKNHFLVHGDHHAGIGLESWKIADVINAFPPQPPNPQPEVQMHTLGNSQRVFDGAIPAGKLTAVQVGGVMGLPTGIAEIRFIMRVVAPAKGGWAYAGPTPTRPLGADPKIGGEPSTLDFNAGIVVDIEHTALLDPGDILRVYSIVPLGRVVIDVTAIS